LAFFQAVNPGTYPGETVIVGDENGSKAVPGVQVSKKLADSLPRLGIHIASGFIRQEKARLADQCPGKRYSLLLSA
jgi:hypothetical protein